jgi:hypothetical protein
MLDQESEIISSKNSRHKQISEPSINTDNQSKKDGFLNFTTLIRSIQRAEGNPDCFRRSHEYCIQIDCHWHPYCIKSLKPLFGKERYLG